MPKTGKRTGAGPRRPGQPPQPKPPQPKPPKPKPHEIQPPPAPFSIPKIGKNE